MNIPFVDLCAEYYAARDAINCAINRVISSAAFIGGEEVEAFEREMAAHCGLSMAWSTFTG